ncbi:MAG: mannose-1-phosphate guanylyltransferase [Microcystaceae cyanobacterium]
MTSNLPTSKPKFIAVILAGGKGERFWPLSRRDRPKQFLALDGSGHTLLQSTANRLLEVADGWENLWVITSEAIAAGVKEQLPKLRSSNLLSEPEGKDTAPAVAWATLEIAKRYGPDTVIGFFPADHWIARQNLFESTLEAAIVFATEKDSIVTLGIRPLEPASGYGYIEQGEFAEEIGESFIYKVNRFTEKPDRKTAEILIAQGSYSWNSGMFFFRADVVLTELRRHAPDLMQLLEAQGANAYSQLEKKSIDYVLMEKTDLAYVLPATFGWDDLGDWNALERMNSPEDNDDNNINLARHISEDTYNSIVYASDQKEVIVTIGLDELVIVRDQNVTLIAHKNRTQDIKKILKKIQQDESLKDLL